MKKVFCISFLVTVLLASTSYKGTVTMSTMTMITEKPEVNIYLAGSGKCTIDWGDETVITVTLLPAGNRMTETKRHVYNIVSKYTITITGENITRMVCSNNQLTSLDVSNSTSLRTLNCKNNNLGAVALNALFETLHSNDVIDRFLGKVAKKELHISENPGIESCSRSIAVDKGWEVMVEE